MNLILKTILITLFLACFSMVHAKDSFSTRANLELATDYVLRGLTQTDGKFSAQGYTELVYKTDFYIGTFASNVDFAEDETVRNEDRADIGMSVYGGYDGKLSKQLRYELMAGRYMYPGAASYLNYDTTEFMVAFIYDVPRETELKTELRLEYNHSPNLFGFGEGHHYEVKLEHELVKSLSLSGQVGQQFVVDNEGAGFDDYIYHGLSLTHAIAGFKNFEISLDYSNTNIDNASDFGADDRVFLILSKDFR